MKSTATPRFRIVSRLGSGEMTESLLCRLQGVEGFEKEVVVRRLTPERAHDRRAARTFLDQARVIARLSHANIIHTFEVGEDPEGPYAAMEYVKGVTLQMIGERAARAGKVHYGHLAKIVAGACDALAYLHGAVDDQGRWAGVVHRDVSLAGVVVSTDGIAKLHDLALASVEPQHSSDPVTNAQYARRVDAFGVGATLFKLTTGHSAGHLRPSEIAPDYPADLELIVLAAIEARTADPFPSAQQLSDLLEDFAAGPAHRSTPTTLVAWLRDLFPDLSALSKTAAALLPVATAAPHGAAPQAELPPDRQVAMARSAPPRYWKVAVAAAAVLVVAFGVLAVVRSGPSPSASLAPAPTAAPAPPPPPSAPPAPTPPPAPTVTTAAPASPPPPAEPPPRPAPEAEARRIPRIAANPPAPARRTERPERSTSRPASAPPRRLAAASSGVPAPRERTAGEPVTERAPEPTPEAPPAPSPPPPEPARPPASAPAPVARPIASTTAVRPPERPTPARGPSSSGPTISAAPKSHVPIPTLPRMLSEPRADQVARACQLVESAAVSLAGVSPEFARGVTGPLRRTLKQQSAIYPIAMYYFVVREAALRHDSATAAANLAAAQVNGVLVRFKDLPGIEKGL